MVASKVYQDDFGYMSGNCVWACIATIFPQFTLDDLRYPPPYDQDIANWTGKNLPGLFYHSRDLCTNYRIVEGFPYAEGVGTGRWTFDWPNGYHDPPVPGLWMATIPSPGLTVPESDPYFPHRSMHAVVFEGSKLFHDPNPRYKGFWEDLAEDGITPRVLRHNWWSDEPYTSVYEN